MQKDTSKFREDRDGHRDTQSSQNDYEEHDSGRDLERFVGTTIKDTYKVLELIGKGGMSAVYRAEHVVTQKTVALKMMHSHLLTDNNSVRRFQQEAKAASRLQHQNAISVSDLGITEDGQPFLVMDYLEGWSLSEVIKFEGKLEVNRAYHIFKQACSALAHAHEKGIVHRDLKPSNIMLIRDGRDPDFVKVVDFGIAKILPDGGGEALKLTATGEVFGSPLYMSPEQCMGQPMDARSDIYSMGCLMYEALSGHAPLEGRNMMETMYKQMNEQAAALSDVDGDVRQVKKLDEIIQKCMAKKPDDRYETMDELEEDLQEAESSVGGSRVAAQVGLNMTQATRALKNRAGPRWRLILGLLAGVMVLTTGLGWFANDRFFSTAGDPSAKERTLDLKLNFASRSDEDNETKIEGLQEAHRGVYKLGQTAEGEHAEFYYEMKFGDFYMRVGRPEKALASYLAAEQSITKTQLELAGSDYAHLLRGEAFCNLMKGNLEKAEEQAKKSLYVITNTLQTESSWTKLSTLGLLAELHRQRHDPQLSSDIQSIRETYDRNRGRTNDLDKKQDVEPDYPFAAAIALKQGGDGAFSLGQTDIAESMYHQSLKEWVELEEAQGPQKVAVDEGVVLNDLGLAAMRRKLYNSAEPLKTEFDDLNLDWILDGPPADAKMSDTKTKPLDLKLISEAVPLRDDHNRLLVDEHKWLKMVYPQLGAIGYFKAAASRISRAEPVSDRMAIVLFNLADAYRANKEYMAAANTRLQAQKVFRAASKEQSRS